MAKKQVTIELVEGIKGLSQAAEEHPHLRGGESIKELWKHAEEPLYEVVRLTNTIDYKIGEKLDAQTVRDLCGRTDWKVVVTTPKA